MNTNPLLMLPARPGDAWADAIWPWLSDWLHSPGFAGAAALAGGCIFYAVTACDTARCEKHRRRTSAAAVARIAARQAQRHPAQDETTSRRKKRGRTRRQDDK